MKKKPLALVAALVVILSLGACSGGTEDSDGTQGEPSTSSGATSPVDDTAETKDTAGINELPVGDSGPQTQDALTVDAVYFQAIDLEMGSMAMPPASQSDMHFEVDVATNDGATDWGYEADQFMPYLDVSAVATNKDTGEDVDLGTMMPMIASDGPHYGNNISLEPGNYDVVITIGSPADNFMLHTGKDSSGVKGRFWTEPLKFEFDNWQWDGQLL